MKRPLPSAAEAAAILATKRSRPPRRGPPPAGRGLTTLIRDLDAKIGKGVGGLAARWKEIVGEPLFRATEPVRILKGRAGGGASLEIRVDGPAAALIQHQAPRIIDQVNLFLGAGSVERLRIVQGPVRRAASPARAVRRKQRPLDAAAEAELEKSLVEVENPKLKAALARLGRNVLRQSAPH